MTVSSLEDVLQAVQHQLNNDLALRPLCTRVMLRTGVNLRAIRPDQSGDRVLLGKVVGVLREMGYKL